MKIIILTIYLLLINSNNLIKVNTLSSNIACNIVDNIECTGKYDTNHNYKEVCEKVKCIGKYGYQCTETQCTFDKTACEIFNKAKASLRSFKNLRIYNNQLIRYQEMIRNIENCPTYQYQFHLSDVCRNGLNCFQKQTFRLRKKKIDIYKKTECPCGGNHTYHCGRNYCSVNKTACESFTRSNQTNLNALKFCQNGNTISMKSFLIF